MILETVRKTIRDNSLIDIGDTVICAVSGGADSICLLKVMLELKDEYNLNIAVANVNHMIRGEESDRDSDFVKQFCNKLNLKCFYREYDVVSTAKELKIGEEECGRILRYKFFEEIANKLGEAKIATAHNLNDNAETMIFRLVRGSSAQGLSGIKYKRGNIIRPLLDVTRQDIEKYLHKQNITWCEDSTNKSTVYNRNKIRLCVMPLLEEISPNAQQKITSASKLISDDSAFLDDLAKATMQKCFFGDYLLTEPLEKAHISIKRRITASVLEKWNTTDITLDKIENFLEFVKKDSGKRFDINANCFAEKNYDRVSVCKYASNREFTHLLDTGKNVFDKNWTLTAEIKNDFVKRQSNNIAVFDADALEMPLLVRYRRNGDKIALKGVNGPKKISDVFTDAKVDRYIRDDIPIIEKDGEVLFVCGVRQSVRYSVNSDTKRFLIIKYTNER